LSEHIAFDAMFEMPPGCGSSFCFVFRRADH